MWPPTVQTYENEKKSLHKDIQFFFEKLVWKATDQNSVSPYRHTKCQHTKAWSCRSCDFPFKTSSNFKLERTVKQAKQTGHHIRLNNSRNGEIYRSYGNNTKELRDVAMETSVQFHLFKRFDFWGTETAETSCLLLLKTRLMKGLRMDLILLWDAKSKQTGRR